MKTFLLLAFWLLVVNQGDAIRFRKGTVGPYVLPFIGDWIVILQRFDGSVDFNRNWVDYRDGFGNKDGGEFWLGNEKVHRLTKNDEYVLRIEMYSDVSWYSAEYTSFSLDPESKQYAIHISGFSGNASDSLTDRSVGSDPYHGGMSFSTPNINNDRDNSSCSNQYRAGWWFNDCGYSCLTCKHGGGNFYWKGLNHLQSKGKLGAALMMIQRRICALRSN